MGTTNIEVNIHDQIMTQLKGISGGTNYNFNIPDRDIFTSYKYPGDVNPTRGKPIICLGETIIQPLTPIMRGMFNMPIVQEIWGYVHDSDDPHREAKKLCSDIRIALLGAQSLKDLVTHMEMEASIGAMDNMGILLVSLSVLTHYDTDE